MKNDRIKKQLIIIFILSFLCVQFFAHFVFVKPSYTSNEDVYDVILFWGQSNMVGSCGNRTYEKSADTRYTNTNSSSVKAYSKKSGIDETFLSNSVRMNYVKITQTPNTVYEYNYLQNSLNEINQNTEYLGEKLVYNSGKLITPTDSKYSIQKSAGTNIIPQFAKTYYEKTGHKVIVVFAANGGEKISHFLPSTDSEYDDANNQMIYESMVIKYKAAIKYLNDNNYNIGRKIWVSFQGESDVSAKTTTSTYKSQFLKVHNYLKNDLKITQGAIIQTSFDVYRASGTINSGVKSIRDAQVQLANENDEIVLGSKYAYSHYIPHEESYNNASYTNSLYLDENGNKLPFEEAFSIAASGVCDDGSTHDNTIHFTSAALCQIGKETAELLVARLQDNTAPDITVSYSTTAPTNGDVIVTLTADEDIKLTTNMENNGWTRVDSKTVQKIYSENVTNATRTIYDLSGNGTEVTVNINNIDKTPPTYDISYSDTNLTNKDVVVTLAFNEDINYTDNMQNSGWSKVNSKTYKKTYSENVSNAKRTIYDLAGNSTEVTINIDNIDKVTPEAEVSYSTSEETYDSVTVTIHSNEALKDLNGWTRVDQTTFQKEYFQNTNGKITITIEDLVGNKTQKEIEITNIKNPFSIKSQKYDIDNMIITMVDPNTSVNSFYSNITTNANNKKIIGRSNIELSAQDLVTTNSILILDDKYNFIIIVRGDLNGDGKVTISDLALIQGIILEPDTQISEACFNAGDLDKNKVISIKDLASLKKYILTKLF